MFRNAAITPPLQARRLVSAALVGIAAAAAANSARAQLAGLPDIPSSFSLTASVNVLHDDNLFRLPSSANVLALTGSPTAADTITTSSLGFKFDKSYSLQRVQLDVNWTKVSFDRFSYLDFSAPNYRGTLNWSYTPHFYGDVVLERQKRLNSFSDFQGFRQRNEREDSTRRVSGTYELDTRWRLRGSVARNETNNTQALSVEDTSSQSTVDAGPRYVFPSGSYLGATLRAADGSYPDRVPSTAAQVDNAFTERTAQAEFFWLITPRTTANFTVGHQQRSHPNFARRDFDGTIADMRFSWQPSGKTGFTARWIRGLGSSQTASTDYFRSDRMSLGPVWQISPKVIASLSYATTLYDYQSNVITAAPHRKDTYRDTTLAIEWQPRDFVTLGASLQEALRSSSLPSLDFNSRMVSLNAKFNF